MEVATPVLGPQPWGRVARATLGVGVPLAAGLTTGAPIPGVLAAMGGLAGALADRPVPYPARLRGIALAGAGAAVGLGLGTAMHGRGWLAVAALVLLAGLSALISGAGVTWSVTAFCLLLYAVLGIGPLGVLAPAGAGPPLLLAGVCWSLLLLVSEWTLRSRFVPRPQAGIVRRTGAAAPTPGRGTLPQRLPAVFRRVRLTFNAMGGARLMLCVAVAAIVSEVLPLGRSYWVLLPAAVVVKPDFGSTLARALRYVAGMVVGAVVAGLIVATGPPTALLLLSLLVLAALLPFAIGRNYGLVVVVLTAVAILLVNRLGAGGGLAPAEARTVDIVIGCAVVLGIGFAPWPRTWHARLPAAFAGAVDRAADYLDSTLPSSIASASMTTAQARVHKELTVLRMEFPRAVAEAEAARSPWLAWKPAVDALERLVDAVTATRTSGEPPPSAAAVAEVNQVLRETAAAVRSGGPALPEAPASTAPSLEHVVEALRDVLGALGGVRASGDAASVRRPTRGPGRGA